MNQENSLVLKPTGSKKPTSYDARLWGNQTHILSTVMTDGATSVVRHYDITQSGGSDYSIARAIFENRLLKHIVFNLWHNRNYQQNYTAFLLGTIDKPTFKEIAKSYARPYITNMTELEIDFTTELCITASGQSLNSGEISEMINIHPSLIENTLHTSEKVGRLKDSN
jgi:hypothetical protein